MAREVLLARSAASRALVFVLAATGAALGALGPACGSNGNIDPQTTGGQTPDDETCIEIARGFGDVEDAEVRSDEVDANRGASDVADVGVAEGGGERRMLLRFDLASVPPDATIKSASLELHAAATTDVATVFVHRVTAPWSEADVTFASLGAAIAPDHAALFANGGQAFEGTISVDLKVLVADWASGLVVNRGVALQYHLDQSPIGLSSYTTSESAIALHRPKLSICYVPGAGGPTCFDGVENQDEEDVDCGGPCAPCDLCSGVSCPAADACHLVGTCDPATGLCSDPAADDGTSCDDGDACTQSDVCIDGACTGNDPVSCVAADDCHEEGTCDPATGLCSGAPLDDGVACDDGDGCTLADTCETGLCVGSTSPVAALTGAAVVPGPGDPDGVGLATLTLDEAQGTVCFALSWTGVDEPTAIDLHEGAAGSSGPVAVALAPSPGGCTSGVSAAQIQAIRKAPAGFYVELANPAFPAGALRGQLDRVTVCAALDQCHVKGVCDAATGVCSDPIVADDTACNDGDACTQIDTCDQGVCAGAMPVLCFPLDACHVAGVCDSKDGTCSDPAANDGTACDDGDACTQSDTCQAGACAGANPVVCAAIDGCHVAGTCDTATGACSSPAAVDGTACDDGNACMQTDTCQAGTCVGANPVGCVASDGCHVAGTCDTTTGVCSNPIVADGTACDDGNACTQIDTCQAGTCVGASPVACAKIDACHVSGTCDPATGACSSPNAPDGLSCNDGDACTQVDTCQAGACTGASPVICGASDQCHVAGTCNPLNGLCSNPSIANGTACSDGNACTQTDTCQAGFCSGANPVVCAASDQCHAAGTCDTTTGACSNPSAPDGAACNDGDACTQTDTCQAGSCAGANPVVCAASDACHAAGTCNAATGVCSNPNIANGTACDDGNACTQIDTCQSGFCTGSSPVVCAASDQCHVAGTCDTSTGVCSNPSAPDGAACTDGDACTQTDTCQAGVCAGASPVVCAASDQCHVAGTCSPATGICSNPAAVNGASCDDGNACTQVDTCQAGFCTGSSPVVCAASDQCHVAGTCDTATGACSNPTAVDGLSCNDGDACTQTDTCQAGTCAGANPVVCAASDQCHVAGTCDAATGTCSNPNAVNGAACSDGDACTQVDTCQAGACTGASPVVCAASDQCHVAGTCDAATGTCSNPTVGDGSSCDDGDVCTQTDTCQAGTCTGANPVAGACTTGLLGVCAAGTLTCANNVIGCAQTTQATLEVCDGLDNDCDGLADDQTDPNDTNTCGGAATHTVSPGGLVDVFGTVDADGDDYFVIAFSSVPAAGGYYHPLIDLVDTAGGAYTMTVLTACGSGIQCGMTLSTFEMLYPADPNGCIANGNCTDDVPKQTQWVVRVQSVGGAPVCASYHLQASNI